MQTPHQGSESGDREELASPSVGSRHSAEREAGKSQTTSGHKRCQKLNDWHSNSQHNKQAFTEACACPLLPLYFLLACNVCAYLLWVCGIDCMCACLYTEHTAHGMQRPQCTVQPVQKSRDRTFPESRRPLAPATPQLWGVTVLTSYSTDEFGLLFELCKWS